MKKNLLRKIIVISGTALATVGSALAYNVTYAPSDMSSVAIDVMGEAGVQFKTYMPLLILFGIVALGTTAIVGIKAKIR